MYLELPDSREVLSSDLSKKVQWVKRWYYKRIPSVYGNEFGRQMVEEQKKGTVLNTK
jgi:hypothetical protein